MPITSESRGLISTEKMRSILKIKSEIIHAAGDYLRANGFIEILPVILSPVTDPLRHTVMAGEVDYYGQRLQLTKSMILHKQVALRTLDRIFSFSPNIRFEPPHYADCGRYLTEFVQLDLEVKDGTRDQLISLGEELLTTIIGHLQKNCSDELHRLSRELTLPSIPFERITYEKAQQTFGKEFDIPLSQAKKNPIWVVDFPLAVREFYDREDKARSGILVDMDLIYPHGFGEALSGGEREYTLERILTRLSQSGVPHAQLAAYLKIVQEGIPPSAGFGIGIERLTRYICGLERIEDARLFAKPPGTILTI
ncbi:asparagine synthetase A [Candidatus Acetothermia bacterium]|jgi:asparaginyl-tRNA synthetase|nr:asparagine synthetase A [Candidatus Acetothermia bacterium]MCI2426754.1 asparagine synthetase A [Candidatus Acetothermia bacterium]MCI2427019.1 asparagine synthetase A [Candidatus Acetothermia bacterium]MCI2428945.1 asparagine synthetase A [Candidatus Acetothermia bacterium]